MKKISLSILVILAFSMNLIAQLDQYGPFVGGNAFVYKSNLYNAHDLAADSVQKFAMTMGFGAGFDFGYRAQNGVSISSGLSYGTCNQNYKGSDSIIGDKVTFSAKTTMSFIKIPLVLSMQSRSDKAAKAFYSVGLFYSYNAGFSETAKWDYALEKYYRDQTTTIKKETIESTYAKDTNKYISTVDQRPYKRHGWGAIMAIGVSKKFNKNSEWFCQAKIEYQLSSSENNEEMVFTPAAKSADKKHVGHVWGNYAKYMYKANSNSNRPATHPFNVGLTFGIRYYLFDFE